jgi:hypothetical protein
LKKTTPGRALENLFYLQYDLPPEASFHATTEEAKRPDELYMRKLLPELTRLKLQPCHVVANDEAYYAAMKGISLFTPEAEKLMHRADYYSARRQIRLCAPDLKRRNEAKRPPKPALKFY